MGGCGGGVQDHRDMMLLVTEQAGGFWKQDRVVPVLVVPVLASYVLYCIQGLLNESLLVWLLGNFCTEY